jgi:hypothetical protein
MDDSAEIQPDSQGADCDHHGHENQDLHSWSWDIHRVLRFVRLDPV